MTEESKRYRFIRFAACNQDSPEAKALDQASEIEWEAAEEEGRDTETISPLKFDEFFDKAMSICGWEETPVVN